MKGKNSLVRRETGGGGIGGIRKITGHDYAPKLSSAGSRRSVSVEDASLVERIEIFKKISSGAFAKVYKGRVRGIRNPPIVAIKAVNNI